MSKHCPVYNCIVLYLDCLECEEKLCKHITSRGMKLHPGDIISVKTVFENEGKFMYIGSAKNGKRILYRLNDEEFIFVDSDFVKLKRIIKIGSDKDLLKNLKGRLKNEI